MAADIETHSQTLDTAQGLYKRGGERFVETTTVSGELSPQNQLRKAVGTQRD